MSTPPDPDGLVDVIGVVDRAALTPRSCWAWLDLIFERMAAHGQADVVVHLAGICREQGIAVVAQVVGGRVWVSIGAKTADPDSPILLGHVVVELVTDPVAWEGAEFLGVFGDVEPTEAA